MAGSIIELSAAARERVGKGAARQARREGKIPAVIYGNKKDPETIVLDGNEVWKHYSRGNFYASVFRIAIDGEERLAVARDMQLHPLKDTPIHVDFQRVREDGMIRVEVPVHFKNREKCPALKRGGALNVVRHQVEVWCPYDQIPAEFVVDLDGVQIGTSIHISSITIPDNVTPTISDRDFTVATLTGRMKKEDAEVADGEEGAKGKEATKK